MNAGSRRLLLTVNETKVLLRCAEHCAADPVLMRCDY